MKQYVVDAFADKVFEGNPAAVCVMDRWIDDALMQKIAIENNLSETAFVVWEGESYHLRWFTPGGEVDLCGHATLGTSFVLANFYKPEETRFEFDTLSGRLIVTRKGDFYEMDFPSRMPEPIELSDHMIEALNGIKPLGAYLSRDLMLGPRRSPSTNRTFLLSFASARAVLTAMELLPSDGTELVKRMT